MLMHHSKLLAQSLYASTLVLLSPSEVQKVVLGRVQAKHEACVAPVGLIRARLTCPHPYGANRVAVCPSGLTTRCASARTGPSPAFEPCSYPSEGNKAKAPRFYLSAFAL